jgi:hypothetical protein
LNFSSDMYWRKNKNPPDSWICDNFNGMMSFNDTCITNPKYIGETLSSVIEIEDKPFL